MRKANVKIGSICIAAAAAVGCLGLTIGALADSTAIKSIDNSNRTALLGVENPEKYFLGIASQFSVFVEEDFSVTGSDCEGRLGAGGNANMGDIAYDYSVGAKLPDNSAVAHVVVGGNTLRRFQPNGINFVVGKADNVDQGILEYAENGSCNLYEGELIDFEKEFDMLRSRSRLLASLEDNATLEISPYYAAGWTVRGSDPELNVLTLTAEQVEEFNEEYIEFSIYIPEGSYLVINVEGDEHVDMPGNSIRFYNEDDSVREVDVTQIPVLYNLADATSFHYMGSLSGSTLAPNADGTGDEGGHVSGATFAKSFTGSIEFGYTFFNMSNFELQEPETTTTTTETTTTTTTAATTTTTEATTTTTEATTTTTTTTEATTTTTTTTEATTTTTEATTTTTEETTTTTEETTTETSTVVSAESDVNTTTIDDSDITDDNPASTTQAPETETTEETTTTTEETTTTTEGTTTTTEETTTTTEATTTTTEATTTTTTAATTTTTAATTTTTAATTTTGTGTTTTGSPATGDPLNGGVLAAASAALLGMTVLRKRK